MSRSPSASRVPRIRRQWGRLAAAGLAAAALVACGGGEGDIPGPPSDGPLALRVVFPEPHGGIPPGGAGYVIGSLGNGDASLAINGRPVAVHPGGGFLAYLPVSAEEPTLRLTATLRGRSVTHHLPLAARSPVPAVARGSLAVDGATLLPRERVLAGADERVRVAVRAPADAEVWVQGDGGRAPLFREPVAAPRRARPGLPGRAAVTWSAEVAARVLRGTAALRVARGADTVHLPVAVVELRGGERRWAELRPPPGRAADAPDGIVARAAPGDAYRWFLLPGTRVEVTGRRGSAVRVRLDAGQEAWVAERDVHPLPDGFDEDGVTATAVEVRGGERWSDVVVPVTRTPPHEVEVRGDEVVLTLFGTRGVRRSARLPAAERWVAGVEVEPAAEDRLRLRVRLAGAVYGYRVFREDGRLVLRIRRAPAVDATSPLRGRVVAVDAGHPPSGATGPTGLRERVVTLAVARRLARLLRARGAIVVLTRTGDGPVELDARAVRATRADADALISIHVDALPQEVSPLQAAGTSTHFFHPFSHVMAHQVQRGMVGRIGLDDRGVWRRNLAMVRPTWMPSVLTEGATLVVPEHEAALRTARFHEDYALGIADGLEAYFALLARGDVR